VAFEEQFGAEDWQAVVRGVFQAALAIVAADPGGLLAAAKEGGALASVMRAGDGAGGLVDELVADIKSDRPSMKEIGIHRQPKDQALSSAIEAMKHAASIVEAKAPAEAAAYKSWLFSISERVAKAAKEGGLLGFGGELVSDDEQAALGQIKGALGV
jgi:hypothetical protein